jgi:hypothetical protein
MTDPEHGDLYLEDGWGDRRWEDRHEPFVTYSRYGWHVRCSCGQVWRGPAAQVAWSDHVREVMTR